MRPVRLQIESRNRRSSAAGCRLRGGFTLVELAMVLALLGIAAAIAVPRYTRSLQRYRVESAARQAAAQFDFAVRWSRAAGRTLRMTADTASHTLLFTDSDLHVISRLSLAQAPFEAALASASLSSGTQLTIDGHGSPSATATLLIAVGDETRTVTFDAATGRGRYQ